MEGEGATFKTLPCALSNRSRMYRLNDRVTQDTGVLNVHTEAFSKCLRERFSVQGKKKRTRHNTHRDTQHTLHLNNLFLHEASNSPTNEGPRPTHSGPQGKCFLTRELSGRGIIVIVSKKRDEKRETERSKKERDERRVRRERHV